MGQNRHILEGFKAGQQAAKARGKRWGGSKRGLRKRKTGAKVKFVLALFEQGLPKAHIAKAAGISVPTVYSILRECTSR